MINRRILRAKAVQYVYSYLIAEKSNLLLTEDYISDRFKPDLLSMEPQDLKGLEDKKSKTLELYHRGLRQKETNRTHYEPIVSQTADQALAYKDSKNLEDQNLITKQLQNELKKISENYWITLYLFLKLYDVIEKEIAEKFDFEPLPPQFTNELRMIEVVRKSGNDPSWQDQILELVYTIYKENLMKDTYVIDFVRSTERDIDTESTFFKNLFTEHLHKHGLFEVFMENHDLNWSQNKSVIKDMVNKTIKNFTQDPTSTHMLVQPSPNWEEDSVYCLDLFQHTVRNIKEYKKIIASKLENWDFERVTVTEIALISTAIAEMIHFPSIPVKVTINEFLEISKTFGEEKNKNFTNGLLDKISKELEKQKIIQKSGRGLIDNK